MVPVIIAGVAGMAAYSIYRNNFGCEGKPEARRPRPMRALPPARRAQIAGRGPIACPALPWLPEQIDYQIYHLVSGHYWTDPNKITCTVLHNVYGTVPGTGQTLRWPTHPKDCDALQALEATVYARVMASLLAKEASDAEQIYERAGT